ncbi:MAG: hypothetical protein HOF11_08870 [Rhodospirillaceae bacterium]|jgi:hypothetical protein|nr:hypothetical protein [Rhodospirillaceae bacterium]
MSYIETISFDATDRIETQRSETRLPYFIAVPIWISLAVVAWSPILLIVRALAA